MNVKTRLTKLEKSWILYDVGNSALTLLVSTLIPIYFNALAGNAGINEDMSLRLQAMGGALYVLDMGWGGYAGADLVVGANVLEGKRMFVGGEVGYRAKIVSDKTYSFIPLQAVVSSILTDQRHSPIIGMNIGYGISTNKKVQGGICAGAELGWHYLVDENTSIILGLSAEWQQAKADVVEAILNPSTLEEVYYSNHKGVNFITFGAKVAILF